MVSVVRHYTITIYVDYLSNPHILLVTYLLWYILKAYCFFNQNKIEYFCKFVHKTVFKNLNKYLEIMVYFCT